MASPQSSRQNLIHQIILMLNGPIDDHGDIEIYNLAVDLALDRYRQRSSNAVEESYIYLNLVEDQSEYILPNEVIEIRKIFRRGFGTGTTGGTATQMDPFSSSVINLYSIATSGQGSLLTNYLYNTYVKEAGKMFGLEILFNFNTRTHKLHIDRRPRDMVEEVMLWSYNLVPEDLLITGTYSKDWIRRYSLAQSKLMMGQAYERYSSMPGPSGGISLNGATLKSEALTELELLEQELILYKDGSPITYGIIIG